MNRFLIYFFVCTAITSQLRAHEGEGQLRVVEAELFSLETLDMVRVASSRDGLIEKFNLHVGDTVEKDSVILKLNSSRLELERRAAKAEYDALKIASRNRSLLEAAESRQRISRVNLDALNSLKMQDLGAPELERRRAMADLEQATAEKGGASLDLNRTKFEADAKKESVELLSLDIDRSSIRSPFTGVISKIANSQGSFVNAGDPILEFYRMDLLLGVLVLDGTELPPSRAIGKRVVIELEDWPGENIEATIVRVHPRLDIDKKYRAYVDVENRRSRGVWKLLPGMTGNAKVETISTQTASK